jgi:GT2 family glycosyltransferase
VNTADSPLVSVVVVNWNGEGILDRCLQALKEQTFQDYEVILVDNASTDKSIASAEEFWPEILIIKLDRNLGFAEANNIGARRARGQWLALLNNDAFPAPDWLEQLVAAGRRYPESAFFASKLINASN